MPSDTVVCAAEIAPGKACGHPLDDHEVLVEFPEASQPYWWCHSCDGHHEPVRGRQCQTCGGAPPLVTDPDVLRFYNVTEPFTFCPRCIGGVERMEAVDE